jgi:hypothetical protein
MIPISEHGPVPHGMVSDWPTIGRFSLGEEMRIEIAKGLLCHRPCSSKLYDAVGLPNIQNYKLQYIYTGLFLDRVW